MSKNIFEQASKQKLRFSSSAGNLTTEDVWDLPLAHDRAFSLDLLAQQLNRQVKSSEEESFVKQRSAAGDTLKLKFDIVKHIIDVRLAEKEAKSKAAEKRARNKRIMEIIEHKQDEELLGKSKAELEALLEE